MKLKEHFRTWPPGGWMRGELAWDNDPGLLKLAAVTEPGAVGTFDLVASDAQLCRWTARCTIDDPDRAAAVSTALAGAIGRSLAEAGETEVDDA